MEEIRRIRVFVGSPSDTAACRDAVKSAVELVNASLEPRGVLLKAVTWELDARPDVGGDAQQTLNAQIVADCDIYVFVFHSRIGTPTQRARSGAVEEFALALERKNAGANVRLMVYFDDSPISPASDVEQLRSVQQFRKEVEAQGLVSAFLGPAAFKDRLLRDLPSCVEDLLTRSGGALKEDRVLALSNAVAVLEKSEDEGDGYLEYEAQLIQQVTKISGTLGTLGKLQEELSSDLQAMTSEMETLGPAIQTLSPDEKLRLVNGFAQRLGEHATRMEPTSSSLSAELNAICDLVEAVAAEFSLGEVEFSVDQRIAFVNSLRELTERMGQAGVEVEGLERMVGAFPGFTKAMKRSRNQLVAIYGRVRGAVGSTVLRIDSSISKIEGAA
jgi:hypothetical protein